MASLPDTVGGTPAGRESAGAAIERVLRAERDAAAEVDAARARAAARVADARLGARHVLERAEAIAQAIHARTDLVAARRAAATARRATAALDPVRHGALADVAAAAVARELTEPGDE